MAACWINGADAQVVAAPLEGVVISGNRTVTPLVDTGSDVSIITSEELEQRQIRFVSEALREAPGIAVSRSGAGRRQYAGSDSRCRSEITPS